MRRTFLAIAALLALAPAIAEDTPRASLPYSKLMDHQKLVSKLKDLDQLKVSASLSSMNPKVQPSDITVEARLKSGQVVSIRVAADGSFTLPSSPELAQEDPLFVSNQPRGSMGLDIQVSIKTPAVTAQRYADLMRGVTQLDVAMMRQGLMKAPKAYGLLFVFNNGGHTLTLHTSKGDKVIGSETLEQARKHVKNNQLTGNDKSTVIYVAMDGDILRENPQTTFDVLPVEVVPAI
jgi:hypothetical protein